MSYLQPFGWYASTVVDNRTYRLIGIDSFNPAANITSIEFTPTRTSFIADAGPMQFNISFISPIEVMVLLLFSNRG